MRDATLCYLVENNERVADRLVHFAVKKRGFGEGKLNGYGGKPNVGEEIPAAAVREVFEETGGVVVATPDLRLVAIFDYHFPHAPPEKDWDQRVHVFITNSWSGVPKETGEMRPEVFLLSEVPVDRMWDGDRYWIRDILSGKRLRGEFSFGTDNSTVERYTLRPMDNHA